MPKSATGSQRGRNQSGASFRMVNLARHFNWPKSKIQDAWWKDLLGRVRTKYPAGLVKVPASRNW